MTDMTLPETLASINYTDEIVTRHTCIILFLKYNWRNVCFCHHVVEFCDNFLSSETISLYFTIYILIIIVYKSLFTHFKDVGTQTFDILTYLFDKCVYEV